MSAKWFEDHPDAVYGKSIEELQRSKNFIPKTEEQQIRVRGNPLNWIYCDECSEASHNCICENPHFSGWEEMDGKII